MLIIPQISTLSINKPALILVKSKLTLLNMIPESHKCVFNLCFLHTSNTTHLERASQITDSALSNIFQSLL